MSEIPEGIMKAAEKAFKYGFGLRYEVAIKAIAQEILAERNRCLSIVNSIEPHTTLEFLMLETIARRVRGEE